jgi:hypothetical protein
MHLLVDVLKKYFKKVKIVRPNQVPAATPIPSVSSEYDDFFQHFHAVYNDTYNRHYINLLAPEFYI